MLSKLNQLDEEQLNHWIGSGGFVPDFKKLRKRIETAVLDTLCGDRLDQLSVRSRAILIKAMQIGRTRPRHERAIRDLILATSGPDLTHLKRHIDRTNDHRDLTELLFHDLDKRDIVQQILQHFEYQGQLHPSPEFRVISDVDDTIYCNWVDRRYPRRTVYPGVLQLHQELRGDVVLLTGRAGDRAGLLERYYRRRLGALGIQDITMLTGTLVHQFVHPWIFSKKWSNLDRHYQLFPEMRMILFGDTGQADPEFLSKAVDRYQGQVAMAMLHRVRPLSSPRTQLCERHGVTFFDTYVGAATRLHEAGHLSAEKLGRVVDAALTDFEAIEFSDSLQREQRSSELRGDVREAQRYL